MSPNPNQQPNQQKGQPDVRSQGQNKQGFGQQNQNKPGANQQQGKPGYDPSKPSARPEDDEDEDGNWSGGKNMKGGDSCSTGKKPY
jgi:hypothetical protein